ncbi:MAG TPA: transaldolase family protein [Candidatus Eisenbacteria bacterium]|jgi:transaldolase|nr:transaldolase family protein [Candidatus Eisenbacteria bacterium]
MPAPPIATKLFLDGGDAAESRRTKEILGRLDGQTTNPSLIAANPGIKKRLEAGERFTRTELREFYHSVVQEIAKNTEGSLSIEVDANEHSTAEDLLSQGKAFSQWVPNATIKYPITEAGLDAAEKSAQAGIHVNLTLCFSQEQAAAVYAATRATKRPAFVSPFVGRLDDRGECGMDVVASILRMLRAGDGHLLTLTASVRNLDHLMYAIALGSPLITAPLKVYEAWGQAGFPLPGTDYTYPRAALKPIPYREIPLDKSWRDYDIRHPLTDAGLRKFAEAWEALLKPEEVRAGMGGA